MPREQPILTIEDLQSLLSTDGNRVDISGRCDLSKPFYIEGRPGKVTMFAPGLGPRERRILTRFAQREAVVRVAAAQGLAVVAGKDFVDCGRTKLQGLRALQENRQSALIDCGARHVLALLDSKNDAGIVEWVRQLPTSGRKIIVFVGDDDEFVRDVLGEGSDVTLLRGTGVRGTALVMQLLIDPLKSLPLPEVSRRFFDSLRDQLEGIRLSDLLIVSDMTGTLLDQHPRYFADDLRLNLRTAIDQLAKFLLVSGDAFDVIQNYFTIGTLTRPYWVISSGGYRIDQVERSQLPWTWTAPAIERAAKTTLLEQAVDAIIESNNLSAAERT